jgi:hypothetical protein
MYLVLAVMMAGGSPLVPHRIDAIPVSLWAVTGGLLDDRVPFLPVDPQLFFMDDEGGQEPHSIFREETWEEVAADLAAVSDDLEQPVRLTGKQDGRDPDPDMGQPRAAVLVRP